jgi:DNA mismatch repair protein MutS2
MSQELYQQLGFNKIRQVLAERAISERGKSRLENLQSFLEEADYRHQQSLTLEMRQLIALDSALPLLAFPNMSQTLRRAAIRDAVLSADELYTLATILTAARHCAGYFRSRNSYPKLKALVQEHSVPLKFLEDSILTIFDNNGQITDNASSELRQIRRRINKLRGDIQNQVQRIAAEAAEDNISSQAQVAFRNGRLVIPVRASRKNSIPGIIHDQSQTGQTIYIEPMAIVQLNNQLREAELDEAAEIQRILKEKSQELRKELLGVEQAVFLLEELDFLYAKGFLAVSYACEMPEPYQGEIRIRNGRNLELEMQRNVVPLNLYLKQEQFGILISGPNAGGKTVTLKTVGLLALMNQAGLLLPAESSSTLPEFDQIFVDIGDNQSIDGDLSTFSSHILNLKHILEHATGQSLVLLDELGTGTDPDEGAAIAEAVIYALIDRKSTLLATTHHSALKTLPYELPGLENGSMSFNEQTLSPTYLFQQSVPGSSYALEIAERLKLDSRVIDYARQRSGQSRQKIERLITDLQRKITRSNELLAQTNKLERDLKAEKKLISEKRKEIDQKYKRAEKEAYQRAQAILAEMQKELQQTIQEIREKEASTQVIKRAQSVIHHWDERIETASQSLNKADANQPKLHFSQLKTGMWVWVGHLKQNGQIIEINQRTKKVWVDINGSRMRLEAQWLSMPQKSEQRIETTIQKPESIRSIRLDLRGFRGDDALNEADRFIDQALRAALPYIEILHGTGDGILKKLLHEMLKHDSRIQKYAIAPLEQGGHGVTIVEF